jgi:uncharacterized protein
MDNELQELVSPSNQIPNHIRHYFAPAQIYLYEWQSYWLEIPGANRLRLGDRWVEAVKGNLFQVRFENQLGLAHIQPYYEGKPIADPLIAEIISPKFPSLDQHLSFFSGLINDIFLKAARLSFKISAPTARGVNDAYTSPTPLFVLHFICHYFPIFRDALELIQSQPNRNLVDHVDQVLLAQAKEADPDVLISIIQNPFEWVKANNFPLAEKLLGFAPLHVRQHSPYETFNTPENRFILHFLQQIIVASQSLTRQRWWDQVPPDRQLIVLSILNFASQALHHPVFSDVGPMRRLPLESQVLLKKGGYQDMLGMWQIFNHARKPLFEHLQQAIDLHDIATLYEIWVFFALIEEIAVIFGETPTITLKDYGLGSIGRASEAQFGSIGKLVYNQTLPTYSIPLRPDFGWFRDYQLDLVIDAKFRMERTMLEKQFVESEIEADAKHTDLYKMHTYRDAHGVSSAIAIYPGNVPVFYDKEKKEKSALSLKDMLTGNYMGIGAIPMKPGNIKTEG